MPWYGEKVPKGPPLPATPGRGAAYSADTVKSS